MSQFEKLLMRIKALDKNMRFQEIKEFWKNSVIQ